MRPESLSLKLVVHNAIASDSKHLDAEHTVVGEASQVTAARRPGEGAARAVDTRKDDSTYIHRLGTTRPTRRSRILLLGEKQQQHSCCTYTWKRRWVLGTTLKEA